MNFGWWAIGERVPTVWRSSDDPATPDFVQRYFAEQQEILVRDEQFLKECGIAPLHQSEETYHGI